MSVQQLRIRVKIALNVVKACNLVQMKLVLCRSVFDLGGILKMFNFSSYAITAA